MDSSTIFSIVESLATVIISVFATYHTLSKKLLSLEIHLDYLRKEVDKNSEYVEEKKVLENYVRKSNEGN
jgi:hypothetical protein